MPGPNPRKGHQSVTRREVLRRAAIVGGAAWAAPVIQSITTPAFAQVSPACRGCFAVKVESSGVCEDINGTIHCPDCRPGLPQSQSPGGCGCGFRVVFEDCDPGSGAATLTLPPGCTFEGGFSKCASDLCEPAVDNGDGTVTFPPCPRPGKNPACVSYAQFCFCCT